MKAVFLLPLIFMILACANQVKNHKEQYKIHFEKAEEHAINEQLDSALGQLELSFKFGYPNPMSIVLNQDLKALIDSHTYRPKTRELLKQFAKENSAKMIGANEVGDRISVQIQLVNEQTQKPVNNALLELIHADNKGQYFTETTLYNPRIFAYLKSNEEGVVQIETIKPGSYLDDDKNEVPAHIHFGIEANGYRNYYSEFTFEDDPIFKANGNEENVPVASKQDGETVSYLVIIPLQPNE